MKESCIRAGCSGQITKLVLGEMLSTQIAELLEDAINMITAMPIPEELRRKYLERRAKDIAALSEALQGDNFEPFKVLGHQLKGNALSYGYGELATLGITMEEAGKEKNKTQAQQCINELRAWLKKVTTI